MNCECYRKYVLLVFFLYMFEGICLINMLFVVWCMFMYVEKLEVFREVKFFWIIVLIVVVLFLKFVINVDGLNL